MQIQKGGKILAKRYYAYTDEDTACKPARCVLAAEAKDGTKLYVDRFDTHWWKMIRPNGQEKKIYRDGDFEAPQCPFGRWRWRVRGGKKALENSMSIDQIATALEIKHTTELVHGWRAMTLFLCENGEVKLQGSYSHIWESKHLVASCGIHGKDSVKTGDTVKLHMLGVDSCQRDGYATAEGCGIYSLATARDLLDSNYLVSSYVPRVAVNVLLWGVVVPYERWNQVSLSTIGYRSEYAEITKVWIIREFHKSYNTLDFRTLNHRIYDPEGLQSYLEEAYKVDTEVITKEGFIYDICGISEEEANTHYSTWLSNG